MGEDRFSKEIEFGTSESCEAEGGGERRGPVMEGGSGSS
jgi:hypothetical protein